MAHLIKLRWDIQQKDLKPSNTVNKSWSGVEVSAEITSQEIS